MRISYEDVAIGILDEIESPRNSQRRFTVRYWTHHRNEVEAENRRDARQWWHTFGYRFL